MGEAVGPTRKTRILDSCRSGGFQAGWLAGWLARKLAWLRARLWPLLERLQSSVPAVLARPASRLADWLARMLRELLYQLWALLED